VFAPKFYWTNSFPSSSILVMPTPPFTETRCDDRNLHEALPITRGAAQWSEFELPQALGYTLGSRAQVSVGAVRQAVSR
jgi:hypothetical protein